MVVICEARYWRRAPPHPTLSSLKEGGEGANSRFPKPVPAPRDPPADARSAIDTAARFIDILARLLP